MTVLKSALGGWTLLVEEKVLVEMKAVTQLEKVHLAQALNYLEAFKLQVGLLINFAQHVWNSRGLPLNTNSMVNHLC